MSRIKFVERLPVSNRHVAVILSMAVGAIFLFPGATLTADQPESFDIVVYGGTSAAMTSAIQAKQMGKSVVVVSPDIHLGGMTSNGLGWTDTGNKAVIGGLSRQFYHRVWTAYQPDDAWPWQSRSQYGNRGQGNPAIDGAERTMWVFEPHIAEQVFEDWIAEVGVRVDRDQWLDREQGVEMENGKIRSIKTLAGKVYIGKMFIDATYEGDLMATAGIKYHVGRESNATYDEQHNGVQIGVLHHSHHFGILARPVDPYVVPGDPSSGVIARVSSEPPGEFGSGDQRVQAYCFRMCLTDLPENRVPFVKPDGYDAQHYELLARILAAGWPGVFDKFDPIPNRKTDTNNHGPMSSDNIGFNYDYPEASYQRRLEIIDEHENYQRGLFYFLANDPQVPENIATAARSWGLAADEFKDNDHWPHQMYIREARRMVGKLVMTENHISKKVPTPECVGWGSYSIDSHNVQRYITPEGYVQNEGDLEVRVSPYEIAYGSLIPEQSQCENLLVPVCVSSSHIAYGSIRMEPVFMILGQSAATAASISIDLDCALQELPYDKLKSRLLADGQAIDVPIEARD